MQVTVVGEASVEDSLRTRVSADITAALQTVTTVGNRFVVNDSVWYGRKRRGGIGPCVMNSAAFISSRFQRALSAIPGWAGETEIDKQAIDGYGELPLTGLGYTLPPERLFRFLEEYAVKDLPPDADLGAVATRFFGAYVRRNVFDVSSVPPSLHHYFQQTRASGVLRIGVEFETGNIASSFRALTKLGNLFSGGQIDAGVFVTCIDKPNCAARIWPVSNRNGSFQELRQRQYKANVSLPLWEIGFAPDGFDPAAPYLGIDGILYQPRPTNTTVSIDGVRYSVWRGEMNEELLRPELDQQDLIQRERND